MICSSNTVVTGTGTGTAGAVGSNISTHAGTLASTSTPTPTPSNPPVGNLCIAELSDVCIVELVPRSGSISPGARRRGLDERVIMPPSSSALMHQDCKEMVITFRVRGS